MTWYQHKFTPIAKTHPVRRLNMENAFLKKASAYFASQNL